MKQHVFLKLANQKYYAEEFLRTWNENVKNIHKQNKIVVQSASRQRFYKPFIIYKKIVPPLRARSLDYYAFNKWIKPKTTGWQGRSASN